VESQLRNVTIMTSLPVAESPYVYLVMHLVQGIARMYRFLLACLQQSQTVHLRDKILAGGAYAVFAAYPAERTGGTAMQVHGAAQGGAEKTAMPRRGGRLEGLLAIASILVIVAVLALLVWVGPLATSGTETANPSVGFAGSAPIHDDAGNVHRTLMPQGAR
jgi:hypothetical protein